MDYTFNSNWIQSLESPWCTSEKFKYANAIDGTEYATILGIPSAYYNGSIGDNSLISEVDAIEKLEEILSHNFNNYHKTWIEWMLGPLYWDNTFSRYFASYLRYCPKCLALGYHSLYTQLLWVTHCPFHNIPLEDRVSMDRATDCHIPLGIYRRKQHGGFELKRNVPTIALSSRKIFEHWQVPLDVSCITKHLPPPYRDYKYNLYYMPFSFHKHDYSLDYFNGKSFSIEVILSLDLAHFQQISTIISPDSLLIPFTDVVDMTSIESYLTHLYMAIYKSIAKHLRKLNREVLITLNALHTYKSDQYQESLIQLVRRGALTKEVYAYLLWSRDLLGGSDYMKVTPRTLASKRHISYSPFFKYLMYEVKQYFLSDCNMPIANFLAILQYTISKLFLAQYKHYDLVGSTLPEMMEKGFINLNIKTLGAMPLLVSYYNKDSNTCYLLDSQNL